MDPWVARRGYHLAGSGTFPSLFTSFLCMHPMTTPHVLDDHSCEQFNGGGRLVTVNNRFNVSLPTNVAAPTQVGVIALSRDVTLSQISSIRQKNRT
jgi:hypothetical protein